MPHRDPLVAALERIAMLREKVAAFGADEGGNRNPTSIEEALQERERLERKLSELLTYGLDAPPKRPRATAGREGFAMSCDAAGHSDDIEPTGDDPNFTRFVVAGAAFLVAFLTLCSAAIAVLGGRDTSDANAAAKPLAIRCTGVVTSHRGKIDVADGEKCTISIEDSGEREGGRDCRVLVKCPRVEQPHRAAGCPLDGPRNPIRFSLGPLIVDTPHRTATFAVGNNWELPLGDATLRLGESCIADPL